MQGQISNTFHVNPTCTVTRYRLQNDTRLPPSRTVRFSAGRERAIYAIVLELNEGSAGRIKDAPYQL